MVVTKEIKKDANALNSKNKNAGNHNLTSKLKCFMIFVRMKIMTAYVIILLAIFSYEILFFVRNRDRTASYPTALSQFPACGFPAQGSSVLLTSYKSMFSSNNR